MLNCGQDGLTPLHCAARSGHEQVVDLLLEKGAVVASKTKNGLSPLHMSVQGDHVDCARLLLYHKAPIDEVTVVGLLIQLIIAFCSNSYHSNNHLATIIELNKLFTEIVSEIIFTYSLC